MTAKDGFSIIAVIINFVNSALTGTFCLLGIAAAVKKLGITWCILYCSTTDCEALHVADAALLCGEQVSDRECAQCPAHPLLERVSMARSRAFPTADDPRVGQVLLWEHGLSDHQNLHRSRSMDVVGQHHASQCHVLSLYIWVNICY